VGGNPSNEEEGFSLLEHSPNFILFGARRVVRFGRLRQKRRGGKDQQSNIQ
jgi:hypothetical protein